MRVPATFCSSRADAGGEAHGCRPTSARPEGREAVSWGRLAEVQRGAARTRTALPRSQPSMASTTQLKYMW
jgi:hypothetical protein